MKAHAWISVALLALLAPTALAARDFEFDVAAKADLQVEAKADSRYRYTWDWGDGEAGVGAHARHTYERPGVYKVVVTATDDAGREYRRAREVEVKAERPAADVDVDVETDDNVVRVEAEHETRARYEWSWGDGHRSRGRHATHVYAEPGTYEIELKMTHADGSCTYERRTVVARGGVAEADAEDDGGSERREARVRSPGVGVSVSLGHGHHHDDEDAYERGRNEPDEWRSDTSVHSSSSSHHNVPGVGAPMLALALAGAALLVRALRRR